MTMGGPLIIPSCVQIPLPRKGTETTSMKFIVTVASMSSNSITPQGDRNVAIFIVRMKSAPVQIPLPRKGTET